MTQIKYKLRKALILVCVDESTELWQHPQPKTLQRFTWTNKSPIDITTVVHKSGR